MGTLLSVTDPANATTNAVYDVFGRIWVLTRPGDTNGDATVYYSYDTSVIPMRTLVNRKGVTQPGDMRQMTITHTDGLGRVVQTTQESGAFDTQAIVTDTRYDALGRVVATAQPRAVTTNTTTFPQYINPGASALHRETLTTYDFLGRAVSIATPGATSTTSYVTTMSYPLGALGVQTRTIDAQNHCTQREQDTLGRLRLVVEYSGSGCTTTLGTTTYTYDPLDQLTGVTDDAGNATSMAYDSVGRKTTMTDPDMGTWYYTYDANGTLRTQVDARGIPTTFSYDDLDRLTSQQAADVGNTLFGDSFSTQNTTNWTWSGHQTVPYTDGGAQVMRNVGTGSNYNANVYRTTYDMTSGDGVRLRFKVDNANSYAHFSLESSGTPYRRFGVVANGGTAYVQYTTDGVNWGYPGAVITNLQNNTWYVLQLTADDAGGFTAHIHQENNPTVRGSQRVVMPAGLNWRFRHWIYTGAAHLDDFAEFQGAIHRYDEAGVPYGKGRRTSTTSIGGSNYWHYDARGRTTLSRWYSWWLTVARDFTWTYDSADRVQTETYPSGEVLTTSYDMRGRPSRLTSSTHGTLVSSATYTPLDQPLSRTTGNSVVQSWSYPNPDARVMQLTIGSGFNRSYSYDSVGNVTGITDLLNAANNQSYGYDARDRLTSWTLGSTTATYAYNTIGNLTSKAGTTYGYPSAGAARPHAPTTVGGQPYTYDANGNVVSGGGRTYVWTADNRPVSVTTSSGAESYSYDADGNRTRRTGGGVTRIYLEGSKWEEQSGGGTIRTSYLFNGQVVAQRDSTSGAPVVYLHGDHLGSVGLTSSTGGALSAVQEFDPWGTVRSGASSATLRNYTGQYLDGTGLLFYNARYYDPVLARFVSPDPIAPDRSDPQSRNRFAYVLNNPLKYTDPTGFCSEPTTTEAEVAENTRCGQLVSELEGYGYQLGNLYDWQSYELDWVLGGTKRLIEVAGWTIDAFKAAMGIANGGRIELVRERANGNLGGYAEPAWFHFRGTARITLYDLAFISETNSMRTIVHELAHVWDFAQSGRLAGDLQRTTGGTGTTGMFPYRPGGTPASDYAYTSRWEDWADSVAAVVIPEHEEFRAPGTTISYWEQSGDYQRRDFVVQRFSDYRGLGR